MSDDLDFVPLYDQAFGMGLRVALAVRRAPDPANGWFVSLGLLTDAEVFLGALIDGNGRQWEWLEIWAQSLSGRATQPGTPVLTNAEWDARWRARCEALARLSPRTVVPGPWESSPQPPLQLLTAPARFGPVTGPRLKTHWSLCRADEALAKVGLPRYAISSQRFLCAEGEGSSMSFWGLGAEARKQARVVNGGNEPLAGTAPVFNQEGGLLFVRYFFPLRFNEFKRLLEGYPNEKAAQFGKARLDSVYDRFRDDRRAWQNHGLIFSATKSKGYRLLECFLLKLTVFQEALGMVANVTAEEKRPFLTLQPDDFRVRLDPAHRLPASWSFRIGLCRTTDSVGAELATPDARDFRPLAPLENSFYQPKELNRIRSGKCTLRINNVEMWQNRGAQFSGTLGELTSTATSTGEMVEIDILLRGQPQRFLLRPTKAESDVNGELRFQSEPHALSPELTEALKSMHGWFQDVAYRIFPMVSSPVDLYSMAVIGLELLIDTKQTPLPKALDEWLSLATRIKMEAKAGTLAERRKAAVAGESRYRNVLGPQRLDPQAEKFFGAAAPEDIFANVIEELWWSFIDVLLRMIPGGPDSFALSLADAPAQALEAPYIEALSELEGLAERAKSVLFGDLWANAEAMSVLKEF